MFTHAVVFRLCLKMEKEGPPKGGARDNGEQRRAKVHPDSGIRTHSTTFFPLWVGDFTTFVCGVVEIQ
jgi:hypothetical protein